MSVISIRNLQKTYGKGTASVQALRGVDLEVSEGEILFMKGPSGSGKTTLLSIIGCMLKPTGGVVEVLGQVLSSLSDRDQCRFRLDNFGFIFQGHNLIASLTSMENVRLPLLLQGEHAKDAERRAMDELAKVGIEAMARRKPGDMSGGQKQRVAVARALVTRPRILLADEPTASLDASSGRDVMTLLSRLSKERGHTVLVVTHDQRIFHFADRAVGIEDGRITDAVDAEERVAAL